VFDLEGAGGGGNTASDAGSRKGYVITHELLKGVLPMKSGNRDVYMYIHVCICISLSVI
jgi:hypothetical protein